MDVLLAYKQVVKQNCFLQTQINMCVDSEKVRKDLKVEAPHCDQTVRGVAPIRDEVAIYIIKYGYRGRSRIHTRTRRAARFKFLELMPYLFLNWRRLDNFQLEHNDLRLIWAAPVDVSLLGM